MPNFDGRAESWVRKNLSRRRPTDRPHGSPSCIIMRLANTSEKGLPGRFTSNFTSRIVFGGFLTFPVRLDKPSVDHWPTGAEDGKDCGTTTCRIGLTKTISQSEAVPRLENLLFARKTTCPGTRRDLAGAARPLFDVQGRTAKLYGKRDDGPSHVL